MARPRKTEARVLGPYPDRPGRYRLVLVAEDGRRIVRIYETRETAQRIRRLVERRLRQPSKRTIAEALEAYEMYMRQEKGNKLTSAAETARKCGQYLGRLEAQLTSITSGWCHKRYEQLTTAVSPRTRRPYAVDTHRSLASETKTFLGWCVRQKWLASNPMDQVVGRGRRRHGKFQLRFDEAKRWLAKALELSDAQPEPAAGALIALLMGLRASEIVLRVVRDLDNDGRLLWIGDAKTPAGRRTVEVPEILRPLLRRLAEGKAPEDWLLGRHPRNWPRRWVRKICELAHVPVVCAQSMRGLHGTLSVQAGVTSHVVAASLGHASIKTTLQSYAAPGSQSVATQRQLVEVLGATPPGENHKGS